MRNITKIVASVAAAALILASLGALAGCGFGDEARVHQTVSDYFNPIANRYPESIKGAASELELTGIDEVGIEEDDLAAAIFAGFSYKIDDVFVYDQFALVKVTITMKDMAQSRDRIDEIIQTAIADSAGSGLSEESAAFCKAQVMEAIDLTPIASKETIVPLLKRDHFWDTCSILWLIPQLQGWDS